MFKVEREQVNNLPHRTRIIARFNEPQTVEFAGFTAAVVAVISEPSGGMFLKGRKNRTTEEVIIPFQGEPIAKRNPNVDYAIRHLEELRIRERIENSKTGPIEPGKRPHLPFVPGFAFLA